MRRALLAAAFLGSACEEGPNPETLVDDVRVIAAVAEPPVVAPGEPWTLATHVADPLGRGAEVLVWACDTEACAVQRVEPRDGIAALDLVSTASVPLWILACDPAICDLDDPDPADLRDPSGWMQRLPLEGVSLATRAVLVEAVVPEVRPENPEVDRGPATARLDRVSAGDPIRLRFEVPGAAVAWGYSTAGGFSRPSEDVDAEGSVTLTWFAPEQEDRASLYVVFEDDAGGAAVWREEIAIR